MDKIIVKVRTSKVNQKTVTIPKNSKDRNGKTIEAGDYVEIIKI